MKYWLFDGKDAQGPYDAEELKRLPGFTADSVICPDGAMSADQWKPAQFYLIRPPAAKEGGVMSGGGAGPGAAKAGPRMGRIADAESDVARVEQEAPAAAQPQRSLPQRPKVSLQTILSGAAALAAVLAGAYFMRQTPAAKAPPDSARGGSLPLAEPKPAEPEKPMIDEAMQREAVGFVKAFPVQSEASAQPADISDVLEPNRWKAPKNVGEALERRALQALSNFAVADAQRRGKSPAQAKRELSADRAGWQSRGGQWLKRNVSLRWEAEPITASKWKVSAVRTERRGAAEETASWEADLLKRTLKPLDLDSWLAVDPKGGGRWADANAPLGEQPPLGAVAQASPSYEIARPRAHRGPKPPKPGAKPAGPSGPADDIGDEDLGELDEPTPKEPKQTPQQAKNDSFEEPPSQDLPPKKYPKPEPKPQAAKPEAQKPPLPEPKPQPKPADAPKPQPKAKEPPPDSGDDGDGPKKNAMDMSVDELRQYLNRGSGDKQFQ